MKRTYVLSVSEPDDELLIEEVRTRRRARLADFTEIAPQIARWREPEGAAAPPRQLPSPSPDAPA